MATERLPDFEEVRRGLEAAKAAGASCFRYEFDDRVMVFDLGGAPSGDRSEVDKWFARKNGTS